MVTEFIERAWNAYKKNFWQIVGATILLSAVVIGILIAGFLPLVFSGLFSISKFLTTTQFQWSSELITSVFIFFVAMVVAAILSIALGGGLVAVYMDALKGKAKLQTMFSFARKKFFTILGANVLAGIIIAGMFLIAIAVAAAFTLINPLIFSIFFVLGLIATLLISLLFSLVNQAVVVDDKKAVDAVKKSIEVVKSNYLQFLALTIIIAVISIIISFVPYIGFVINWLAVAPIGGIAYTAFYLAKSKKKSR